ncbi:MAG: hypothetical protein V5A48_02710 [Salinivenus sp.]
MRSGSRESGGAPPLARQTVLPPPLAAGRQGPVVITQRLNAEEALRF